MTRTMAISLKPKMAKDLSMPVVCGNIKMFKVNICLESCAV